MGWGVRLGAAAVLVATTAPACPSVALADPPFEPLKIELTPPVPDCSLAELGRGRLAVC